MLLIGIQSCLIVCLLFIAFQDFKQRAISWFLIPLLLIGFVYTAFQNSRYEIVLKDVAFNLSFIMLQLVLLTVYMSVKNKKIVNIVNTYIGIGDILFFVVIAAAFSPFNFIVFYLTSTILTLFGFMLYALIKKSTKEIPLAGSMASVMIVLMAINFCFPNLNFYNDEFFISCFIN